MKKILVLNNYSIERVVSEIKTGLKPRHHLYGILDLQTSGYEVILFNPEKNRLWTIIGTIINKIPFLKIGDLNLQIQVFRKSKQFDIVYAPCQDVTVFLGVLSYFRLFNRKIIAVAHHPFLRGRLGQFRKYSLYFSLRGHTLWGVLSTNVAKEINYIAGIDNAVLFHWGPDILYYDKIVAGINSGIIQTLDIIAVGRTGRDYQTLINAFNNTSVTVHIYCHKELRTTLSNDYSSNIQIMFLEDSESLKYPDLIKLYKTAKIIAVPMFDQKGLCGLTSVTDAIALGIPLLITYNKFIEIDVEKEKIGYWIEANNAKQWKEKAEALLRNKTELQCMAMNAKALADGEYNADIYSEELLKKIKSII